MRSVIEERMRPLHLALLLVGCSRTVPDPPATSPVSTAARAAPADSVAVALHTEEYGPPVDDPHAHHHMDMNMNMDMDGGTHAH